MIEVMQMRNMRKAWDKMGIFLSALCAAHCIAVAIVPIALPALDIIFHSPWFHRIFTVMIFIIGPMAFYPSFKRHGLTKILALAAGGMLLVATGTILDTLVAEELSHSISIAGSALLVTAHLWNLRHSHRHKKCC
jgi:hypothetical protein